MAPFMDRVQPSQGYIAITRKQLLYTFSYLYRLFDRPRKYERLS